MASSYDIVTGILKSVLLKPVLGTPGHHCTFWMSLSSNTPDQLTSSLVDSARL